MGKCVPLILFVLTVALSWALSPWWNPWQYSLSALGSSSNGLAGAAFNGGLALTSYSISKLRVKAFGDLIQAIALLAVLVAAINIDFGIIHFLVATLLFLTLYAYVLLHADLVAYAGTAISLGLWFSHWTMGIPPGITLPELSIILLAFMYLLKDAE